MTNVLIGEGLTGDPSFAFLQTEFKSFLEQKKALMTLQSTLHIKTVVARLPA